MSQEKNKRNEKAITLIALIITIIVMLILAIVAINIVAKGRLFNYARNAAEGTEMAKIKEEAEEVKAGLEMQKYEKNIDLTKETLLTALQEHFEGSTISENRIILADEKYDIIVKNDLSIKVVKHGTPEELEISYRVFDMDGVEKLVLLDYSGGGMPTETELEDMYAQTMGYETFEEACSEAEEEMTREKFKQMIEEQYANYYISYKDWLYINISSYSDSESFPIEITPTVTYGDTRIPMIEDNGPYYAVTAFYARKNGTYKVVATTEDGKRGEATIEITGLQRPEEKFSTVYATTKEYTDPKGNKAMIPAGFAVGTSSAINTIENGLVITDKVDSAGYSTGNEFVWIPVDNINNMIMCKTCGPNVQLNTETLECPNCKEDTILAGKLYQEELTDNWAFDLYSNCRFSLTNVLEYSETGFREPDCLYGVSYSSAEMTQEQYQAKFDRMARSVAKNHGFYVGRYETGLTYTVEGDEVTSFEVVVKENLWTDIGDWLNLYLYQELIAEGTGARSEMIWGCQYDQVMLFVNGKPDGQNPPVAFNVMDSAINPYWDMHRDRYQSGQYQFDKVANIFDLTGCEYELTQEACGDRNRVFRGGDWSHSYDSARRYYQGPSSNGMTADASRASLCIDE